jgi:ribose transport system ATP-binding protein
MNEAPVIEMKDIEKSFPGVRALKGVDFNVYRNEIVGLVGEKGAGKSTLMKILIGIYKKDSGEMKFRSREVRVSSPREAAQMGVGMVFQEGNLLPNLTVAENLFLQHEKCFTHNGFISMREVMEEAEKQLARVELDVSPRAYVRDLTQAQQQMVEIARLLWLSSICGVQNPVLILDEPTSVLLASEIERLFTILRNLESEGSIIFISHRLEEVVELSDRIVILKDGSNIKEFKREDARIQEIQKLMVGHELAKQYYREMEQRKPTEEVVIRVEGLRKEKKFDAVSFSVRRGEILSIVGVLGSGKEDLCRCITGVMKADGGEIFIEGKRASIHSPKDAIRVGIGYIPSDRRDEGLALQMDVMSNLTLVMLKEIIEGGLIKPRKEVESARYWIKQCLIKTPSLKTPIKNLSGGNQQKVVLGKWLAAKVKVLILDHPTRGIDVGAKEEIYKRIRLLASEGMAIILMSDRLEEDIGLCNRMLVMKDGELTGELGCPADDKPAPVDVISYMV